MEGDDMVIKEIRKGKKIIARIVRKPKRKGLWFITPHESCLQTAYMCHPKGYIIQSHLHKTINRFVEITQEVFFVKSGKILLKIYDDNREHLEDLLLIKGDLVVLFSGGHGLEFKTKAEIYEVKQGPYLGDDKVRF
jgi:hypothetical protein